MDSACPKELPTQILSDSDHSTKVAPTTLSYYSILAFQSAGRGKKKVASKPLKGLVCATKSFINLSLKYSSYYA